MAASIRERPRRLASIRSIFAPRGGPAWRAAAEHGIDMLLLERNLELTPTQRLRQLNDALRLVGR